MNIPMMNCENFDVFACANGYSGFRSYLKEELLPGRFLRICNVKGGPGTGKSTLLKTISRRAKARGFSVLNILCSSDPDSADGVIIEGRAGRIGLFDATAPHERDEEIPGALDTTVWLGQYRNDAMLRSKKETILSLLERKRYAYGIAYGYLRICSDFYRYIKAEFSKQIDPLAVRDFAKTLSSEEVGKEKAENPSENLLVGAFGKDGLFRTDAEAKTSVSLVGDDLFCRVLLSQIAETFRENKVLLRRYPSPLCHADSDRLLLTGGVSVASRGNGGKKVSASDFLLDPSAFSTESFLSVKEEYEISLAHAAEYFAKAFAVHKELEEIYREAMDFSEFSQLEETLEEEIFSLIAARESDRFSPSALDKEKPI